MEVSSLTLAAVLTAAGAVATATLITGLVAVLKNVPMFGAWLDAGNEQLVSLLLAGVIVVMAVVDAHWTGLAALFQAFVTWYGIAALTIGIHAAGTKLTQPVAPAFPSTVATSPGAGGTP